MTWCILGFIIYHNDIKTGTAWKIQTEVSHVEVQQNLKDDLRDTIEVLRKMDFIINQYIYIYKKTDFLTSGGSYKYLILTRHMKQFKRYGDWIIYSYVN